MKIENTEQLREIYGWPNERAKNKQLSSLDKHVIKYLEKSPFLIISTYDSEGTMDASPRGGAPGFVKILNNQQIVIPDSKGNNRVDSLVNIVETGRVGILFLIPGVDETLRLNGKAFVSTDQEYLGLFSVEKNLPKTCIIVSVEEVFIHCAKALMRSKLWMQESQINRKELPRIGEILKDQLGSNDKPESQEDMVKRYKNDL